MKLLLTYAVVFLLGIVVFLVAFAPASSIWQLAKGDVANKLPHLLVQDISGTIWSGRGTIRYWNFPAAKLDWSLSPLSLLRGRLEFQSVAAGDNIHLEASGNVTAGHLDVVTTGRIDSAFINPVSSKFGLTYTGRLEVRRVHLVSDLSWFSEADGTLHWDGGPIIYHTSQGPRNIVLPGLDGALQQQGEDLRLDIKQGIHNLIVITLHRTGWVAVNMKVRLFDTAGMPWPAGESPDDTALMLEEQLFKP